MAGDLSTWYKLLWCESVESVPVAEHPEKNASMDLWYDEKFLFKEPRLPAFKLKGSSTVGVTDFIIHGYGLVLASDREGDNVSLTSSTMSVGWFHTATEIVFENWQNRITRPDYFIPQLMRTPELELPGKFKYVS